jgi:hypothetical protein
MKAEGIKNFKGNTEEEGEGFLQQIVRGDKNLGAIAMILRTKDSLWNTTTKDHKRQRNSESKLLLQKSC